MDFDLMTLVSFKNVVYLLTNKNSQNGPQVADDMLHQKVDVESCYIAAQTMRNKIQNSFHELPKESHHSLKVNVCLHEQ
jgi:hypothetical protein